MAASSVRFVNCHRNSNAVGDQAAHMLIAAAVSEFLTLRANSAGAGWRLEVSGTYSKLNGVPEEPLAMTVRLTL